MLTIDSLASLVLVITVILIIGLPAAQAAQGIPFASAKAALGTYTNFSDWDRAVAVPFSFFTAFWTITGWQSPCLIVEGMQDARKTAPKAVLTSFVAMSLMGVVVCFICAFCITDIEVAAAEPS